MTITFPRGDQYTQAFTVYKSDGQLCDIEFDEIYFTVKSGFSSQGFVFQKRMSRGEIVDVGDGKYEFTIMPADTDSLSIGHYVFDIELVNADEGIKQTLVGDLNLTNEVTFVTNET